MKIGGRFSVPSALAVMEFLDIFLLRFFLPFCINSPFSSMLKASQGSYFLTSSMISGRWSRIAYSSAEPLSPWSFTERRLCLCWNFQIHPTENFGSLFWRIFNLNANLRAFSCIRGTDIASPFVSHYRTQYLRASSNCGNWTVRSVFDELSEIKAYFFMDLSFCW